jgi:hypothetical protein
MDASPQFLLSFYGSPRLYAALSESSVLLSGFGMDKERQAKLMAIAFRRPFSDATQAQRDAVNMDDMNDTVVRCSECDAEYVLIYPTNASEENIGVYKRAIEQGMGRCGQHQPCIQINF